MDDNKIHPNTVLVNYDLRRIGFPDVNGCLIEVCFPTPRGKTDTFAFCCCIAIAQDIWAGRRRSTKWTGVDQKLLLVLIEEYGWTLGLASVGVYWNDFRDGCDAKNRRVRIRRDGKELAKGEQGEVANDLFQVKDNSLFLGARQKNERGRYVYWPVVFVGESKPLQKYRDFIAGPVSLEQKEQEGQKRGERGKGSRSSAQRQSQSEIFTLDADTQAADILARHETIVGRRDPKSRIKAFITGRDSGLVLVTGPPGIGKTAFLANLVHELAPMAAGGSVARFLFRRESASSSSRVCVQSLYASLARKSGVSADQPANEVDLLASQFAGLLQRRALGRPAAIDLGSEEHNPAAKTVEKGRWNAECNAGAPEIFIVDAIDEADDPALFLRLVPKPLPPKTFFILSSRPEGHLQGLSAMFETTPTTEIDLHAPENVSDGCEFFREQFPDWPETVVERIGAWADGNFLVLRLFADFARGESIAATDAAAWCDKFSATEATPLRALYARYWLHVHEKCSHSSHPEDSDCVNDLVGLLAITYTALALPTIRRFLGQQWTTARFERVLGYVRQFLLVSPDRPGVREPTDRVYCLFHDTFRSFVTERLSLDLPRLHQQIVDVYCAKDRNQLDLSRLDAYGLSFVTKHAAPSEEPLRVLSLVTPTFLKHKANWAASIVPALDDLSTATEVAANERDFGATLKFAIARELLIQSSRRKTMGLEAMLRVRAGETEAALSDACFFGDADDELLARAESVVRYWKDNPELARDHLRRMDLLSAETSADSSPFGASGKRISPAALEAAVSRIAQVCPAEALRLASAIPEPQSLDDVSTRIENPSWGRAVWDIVATCGRDGLSQLDELLDGIKNESRRAYVLAALGASVFVKDPIVAIDAFRKALSHVGGDKSPLLWVIARYCLWHLPSLGPETAAAAVDALLRLSEWRMTCHELAAALDRSIQAHPDVWAELARTLEEGNLRDLANWRLSELGQCPAAELEDFKDGHIKDLVRATKIGLLARRDPVAAAKLAEDIETLEGCARAMACVAETVHQHDQSRGEYSVESFLQSRSVKTGARGFWSVLELAEIVVRWPGDIRRKVLTWCLNTAIELEPELIQSDAKLALNRLLAKAVSDATPDSPEFFRQIVREAGSETGRRVLATCVLQELPETLCRGMAADLASFGLGETEFDPLCPHERGLFLPETKAHLLSVLARRIHSADPDRGKQLLLEAADLCGSLEDEDDRNDLGARLVETTFRLSPALALEAFHRGKCSSADLWRGVASVLAGLIQSPSYMMSRLVRLELEAVLSEQLRDRDNLYFGKRFYVLKCRAFPPIGSSVSEDPVLSRAWLAELPAFFRGCVQEFGFDRSERTELSEIASLVMQLDWSTYVDIVRERTMGPLVCRYLSMADLRLAVFKSELAPAQLLDDVRLIAAAMWNADDHQNSSQTEIWGCLAAAAAAVDPSLCIRILESVSPDSRTEFCRELDGFIARVCWDEDALVRLFRLLDAASDRADVVTAKARILSWLQGRMEISEKCLQAIADETETLQDAESTIEVAKSLGLFDPGLAHRLAQGALNRAIEMRDAGKVTDVLKAHQYFSDSVRHKSLLIAREADVVTEKRWVLHRIVRLQIKISFDAAVETLSLMSPDDSDMDDTLDAVAEAIASGSDTEILSRAERILVLKNLAESHRSRFIRTLANRCMESGISIAEALVSSISVVDDWAATYLQVHEPTTGSEMALFENELNRRIVSSTSFVDRDRALRISGDHYVHCRPEIAYCFYQRALQEASEIRPAEVYLYAVSGCESACLQLPDRYAEELATELNDAVRSYPFGTDYRDNRLHKVRALLWVGIALWPHSQARAVALLREVAEEMSDEKSLSSSVFLTDEAKSGFDRLVELRGFDVGSSWIRQCIEAFPVARQQEVADCICMRLCDGPLGAERPLEDVGVLQTQMGQAECEMLTELLPMCSEGKKAQCYVALGVTHLTSDRDRALREIDSAVRCMEVAGNQLSGYPMDEIRLTYAATHGTKGVLDATFAFGRAGSLAKRIPHLLSAAVSNSEHAIDLVREAWDALQLAREYVT